MRTIKYIIVDDNQTGVGLLKALNKLYFPNLEFVAECKTIQEAVNAINVGKPDLVFLDVELEGESGFDLFNHYKSVPFQVIFTTAHAEYAIKAIKASCLDFILKPIDPVELIEAVSKIANINNDDDGLQDKYSILKENSAIGQTIKRIAISSVNSISFINICDIVCLEGTAKYTTFYLINGDKHVSSKNIGEYENMLGDEFFRCHKSWIVNLKQVEKLNKFDYQLLLSNKMLIDLSTRKKELFLKEFAKY
jgi:two-component system, LytTR family, response regulator